MDDFTPETEPSGALVPPPRVPPTALALATPAPAPMRRTSQTDLGAFGRFVDNAFDVVDKVADTVAGVLRLR